MKLDNKKTGEIWDYSSYDKLKELLEEVHKLAEESILYLPIMESLDHEEKEPPIKDKE